TVIFANSQTAKITTVDYKQQLINYPTLSEAGGPVSAGADPAVARPGRPGPRRVGVRRVDRT
ncbi:hypothetical protein, partial [Streptomyces sp. NPDC005805]|uniref:hypothetical protein n=1 Tax=Streptomyces sp. NPDC005805 TaxID=3157068 RepID=UPI0033EDC3B3